MADAFLLGAGFSKALHNVMPTMNELYDLLEVLVNVPQGIPKEAYDYAAGNAEALLSYFAIPAPQDDIVEVFQKKRLTELIERGIGESVSECEIKAVSLGLNTNGGKLVSKWHENKCHVLTTNYDSLVETIAESTQSGDGNDENSGRLLNHLDLYPILITPAQALRGIGFFGSRAVETFTLYKLHGSTTWYKAAAETSFAPIYWLSNQLKEDPRSKILVADKRRFIVPPVYDKSTLLSHESVRGLWRLGREKALQPAGKLFVIGYSLPETDLAMRSLLWEGRLFPDGSGSGEKLLYVVNPDKCVQQRYKAVLGQYYDVQMDFVGGEDVFDAFVDWYANG